MSGERALALIQDLLLERRIITHALTDEVVVASRVAVVVAGTFTVHGS